MRTSFLALLLLIALPFTAGANNSEGNNYDDIDGFFSQAAGSESLNVHHFYISKAMLTLARKQGNIVDGVNLEKFIDKIDFIRSADISVLNGTSIKEDKEMLAKAEQLATHTYKEYNYKNLLMTSENGMRNYLFYKYGEGGLCSILIVSTARTLDSTREHTSLTQARVLLIGGTFRAEDIPTMINF